MGYYQQQTWLQPTQLEFAEIQCMTFMIQYKNIRKHAPSENDCLQLLIKATDVSYRSFVWQVIWIWRRHERGRRFGVTRTHQLTEPITTISIPCGNSRVELVARPVHLPTSVGVSRALLHPPPSDAVLWPAPSISIRQPSTVIDVMWVTVHGRDLRWGGTGAISFLPARARERSHALDLPMFRAGFGCDCRVVQPKIQLRTEQGIIITNPPGSHTPVA
jgi:hypothetical protein